MPSGEGGVRSMSALFSLPEGHIRRGMVLVAVAWVVVVGASFLLYRGHIDESTMDMAIQTARSHLEKDILIRRWAAGHGGVYVPPSEQTPPNPHLAEHPRRDVTSTDGLALTLVNPAYMTRQIYELAEQYSRAAVRSSGQADR